MSKRLLNRAFLRAAARRLLVLLATVFLVLTLSFFCAYHLPGDPARLILGPRATTAAIQQFRHQAGLDQPVPLQYLRFLERLLSMDLGDSLAQHRSVAELIRERTPDTVGLVSGAAIMLVLFSFVVPILLRLLRADRLRHGHQVFWTSLAVAPPYVLAVLFLILFAGWLEWVHAIFNPGQLSAWILPCLVLTAYPTALVLKLFESEIGRVLDSGYVARARAYGFSPGSILVSETLPNALAAALAALANGVASFVTGTFFVEMVFGVPGLGSLTYDAIRNNDFPLLLPLCLIFALSIAGISALLDLTQLAINPRLSSAHE